MIDLSTYPPIGRVQRKWTELTLARQFLIAAAAAIVAAMVIIGIWVTKQIEENVTRNAAATTALYVDSIIAPLLATFRDEGTLSEGARRALDETLSQGALGSRLSSFKLWKEGGLIAYSNRPELIGQRFEVDDSLQQAWDGQVVAEFDDLGDDENALERAENVPLLEIYNPIREPWSGEVIAVAEFYEIADELQANMNDARQRSWLFVGAATLLMIACLFGIVSKGSGLIATQRQALEKQVADLSALLAQNEELRWRVQRASSRGAALNERYLKRISADLHDGPAQLLALASLRLGSPQLAGASSGGNSELVEIRTLLEESMGEIRAICRGLTLPHIETMSLAELLHTVVAAHEQRTQTNVELQLPTAEPTLTTSERICTFRFVQEGLNNAFRHAGGVGQSVTAALEDDVLRVTVSDKGGGFDDATRNADGLGLAGMRERVESLGGEFTIESSASGTRLSMQLRLSEGQA